MSIEVNVAKVVISSAMIVTSPETISSQANAHVDVVVQTNQTRLAVPSFQGASGVTRTKVFSANKGEWTADKNSRFKALARQEALGDLSIEQLAELEELTEQRRFARYSRTADEILWERRRQEVTAGLVKALQAYVEFTEIPRRS